MTEFLFLGKGGVEARRLVFNALFKCTPWWSKNKQNLLPLPVFYARGSGGWLRASLSAHIQDACEHPSTTDRMPHKKSSLAC